MAWRAHGKMWKLQPQGHLTDHEKHRGFGDDGTGVLRCGPWNSQKGEASFGHELTLRRDAHSRPAVLIDGWPTGRRWAGTFLDPMKREGTQARQRDWPKSWNLTFGVDFSRPLKTGLQTKTCVCVSTTDTQAVKHFKGRLFSTWGGPILRKRPLNTQWTWEKMSIF